MQILILNTCSTLNRGDAAIVLGQIHLLQKYCPGARIAITSRTPTLDQAFYAPMDVEVLAPLTPALSSFKGIKHKLVGGARTLAAWEDKRRLIGVMRRSDLVLSCGGGYLYSYRKLLPGTTFGQNVVHLYLAAVLNKPVIMLPQSFGPFTSALAWAGVKPLLERQNILKVFARERTSYQWLQRMLGQARSKIALCPDMALYLSEKCGQDGHGGEAIDLPQPILAMNLREWAFPEVSDPRSKRAEYLDTLVAVARFFIQRYRGSVVVIPQALGPDPSEDDREICTEFSRRAQAHVSGGGTIQFRNPATSSLGELMAILSQAAILIGTRLHACLLALLAGVPAISIGYQYKSQGSLDLLGLGRFNTSIADVSLEWLTAAVEETMGQRQELQGEIRRSLRQARRQIDEQIGELLVSLAQSPGWTIELD